MKKTLLALSVLLATQSAYAHLDNVYFRGSPNDWGTTKMQKFSEHGWQIETKFTKDNAAFKIDTAGDWSTSFPANKYSVEKNKRYLIQYYDDSNKIFVHEKPKQDFREDTIYFVFLDRFKDGDPSNNTGNNPATYDPEGKDLRKYLGGDIKGLIQQLPYLQDMGISAIWITPPVDNADNVDKYGGAGYHGYWAKDFFKIDEHLGTEDDFANLASEMEKRGMRLVLDYAPNHSNGDNENEFGALYRNEQFLINFSSDQNTPQWYHHNGGIKNGEWGDDWKVKNKSLFNLSDFNQDSPQVYNYLLEGAKHWIRLGVDGIRIDAIKHMDFNYIQRFTSDLTAYAKEIGRDGFYFFGEWFDASATNNDGGINYTNNSGSALLDFGFRNALERVMVGSRDGISMGELSKYLQTRQQVFNSPDWQVMFMDNHDMARIMTVLVSNENVNKNLKGAGLPISQAKKRVELGLVLSMTNSGIPAIYYGTENYLYSLQRSGLDNNIGVDPYNREMMPQTWEKTPAFALIKKLTTLRKDSLAIQQGTYREIWVSEDVLVYERNAGNDVVIVAVNRGEQTNFSVMNLGLADGNYENYLNTTDTQISVSNGQANFSLATDEVIILRTIK